MYTEQCGNWDAPQYDLFLNAPSSLRSSKVGLLKGDWIWGWFSWSVIKRWCGSEETGHCEHDPKGFISLPNSSLSTSQPPRWGQLLSPIHSRPFCCCHFFPGASWLWAEVSANHEPKWTLYICFAFIAFSVSVLHQVTKAAVSEMNPWSLQGVLCPEHTTPHCTQSLIHIWSIDAVAVRQQHLSHYIMLINLNCTEFYSWLYLYSYALTKETQLSDFIITWTSWSILTMSG